MKPQKFCPQCQTELFGKRVDATYCDDSCRNKAWCKINRSTPLNEDVEVSDDHQN